MDLAHATRISRTRFKILGWMRPKHCWQSRETICSWTMFVRSLMYTWDQERRILSLDNFRHWTSYVLIERCRNGMSLNFMKVGSIFSANLYWNATWLGTYSYLYPTCTTKCFVQHFKLLHCCHYPVQDLSKTEQPWTFFSRLRKKRWKIRSSQFETEIKVFE